MLKIAKTSNYKAKRQSVITIGTFDGVHIGHKKILNRIIELANLNDLNAMLLTFFPHPRMVLQKDANIKMITTLDERAQILEDLGLDVLVVEPFTKSFSRLTAQAYVEDILVKQLKVKQVVIGYDHRFGRNRSSDVSDLKHFGSEFEFTVEEIPMQDVNDVAISSTKIRKALMAGHIQTANQYLGYNFMITGTVVSGKQLGRSLGFPTANIHVEEAYKLIPKQGVYVAKARVGNEEYYGMMNIGNNPTIDNKQQTIEVHFFNFNQNLYNTKIQVELLHWLRDENKFDSLEDLKEQLNKDQANAKKWLTQNHA